MLTEQFIRNQTGYSLDRKWRLMPYVYFFQCNKGDPNNRNL